MFCRVAVPDPVQGLLTPRLSVPRSHPECDWSPRVKWGSKRRWFRNRSHRLSRDARPTFRHRDLTGRRTRLSVRVSRAIRKPLGRNDRRPRMNLLTTRVNGAIVEFSSTVAARNPLHIARCGALESAASDHDSFPLRFTPWSPTAATTRPRNKRPNRTALRPQAKRRSVSGTSLKSSRCHGHTPVSRRCIGAALSAAHPQQNEHANRHRRSTWAGVSWPNDDDIGARAGENIGRTLARTPTTRSTRSVTSLCALSSERLPVRLRASCSRRNVKRHSAEIH